MFRYETCCVDSTYELISDLKDGAEDVDFSELLEHCEGVQDWAASKGYEGLRTGDSEGLCLEDDWSVSFCRGTYDGRPCYFIVWSGIEYIWTAAGEGAGFGHYTHRSYRE